VASRTAAPAPRDSLGGSAGTDRFDGGGLAGLGWYAPSLHDPAEAGVQRWPAAALKAWLRTGHAEGHAALGPMAEVVLGSTSALDDTDLAAMAAYLQGLPQRASPRPVAAAPSPSRRERGARLYREHCAGCHGAQGEGGRLATGELAYPALAGHRTVTQASAQNLLRVIDRGAFSPATAGHPRPFGMPPFAGRLSAEELAALVSHLREDLGPGAGEIDSVEVLRLRELSGSH
jgi:mono/diheme cytochrome c family protein